ncbi:MAG: DUF131 domain-containing protein [Candidatus Bathyarchaeota archaeon]|nr:DUF131 domain-containing protein [Candidatus Bathyarchaeota archaeon]
MTGAEALYAVGFALIFIGVLVIIVAIIAASVLGAKKGKSKVKAGGAVIIGPVPIIFGTDKKSLKTVLLLSMALTVLLIVAMVVYYFLFR